MIFDDVQGTGKCQTMHRRRSINVGQVLIFRECILLYRLTVFCTADSSVRKMISETVSEREFAIKVYGVPTRAQDVNCASLSFC